MMLYCKCEVLIPLLYGKRRQPVEPEVFVKIQDVFNRQFGGFTPLGLTSAPQGVNQGGLWTDVEANEVVEDRSWLVRVYVVPERVQEFEAVVHAIGRELEQKEMLIDIGPPSGKFLKIFHGEGESDEVPIDVDELVVADDTSEEKESSAEAANE